MSAHSVAHPPAPRALLARAWAISPALTTVTALMLPMALVAGVGLLLDPEVSSGAPAWLKPLKFAISNAVYGATLIWLLTFVEGRPRLVATVAGVTAFGLGVEMLLIAGAAALGTTSHFNVSTPAQTLVWATMGTLIVAVWLMNLVAAVLLLRQRLPHPALAWGLRLGLLVSFVGMAVAFLMTSPSSAQLAAAESGRALPTVGAHSVADGGPGLPLVGWSTIGGDLRAPHFIGLHGLQVLPLLGWLLTLSAAPWLRAAHRAGLVGIGGLLYLGLVAILTWQALRGQPVIAPDALTLAALAGLVLVAAVLALALVGHARRSRRSGA